jgi:hypothetical protein
VAGSRLPHLKIAAIPPDATINADIDTAKLFPEAVPWIDSHV